jgi:PAS domain S-box-containing protein
MRALVLGPSARRPGPEVCVGPFYCAGCQRAYSVPMPAVFDRPGDLPDASSGNRDALSRDHARLKNILDSMTDQFFGLSSDWHFTYVNKNAAEQMRLLGKDPVALIGKLLWTEFDVPKQHEANLRQVMSERMPLTDELYYAPLGEWIENHMCPSADGGIVTFQRYVTPRKHAEERLRRSESYLAAGQRLTETGSWGWKIASGEVYWSEQQYKLFGWDPQGPPPDLAQCLQLIHPEDREFVAAELEAAVREARRGDWVCRMVTRDGAVRHTHTTAQPVLEDGRPVELLGVTMDITERVQREAALGRSQEQLAQATRLLAMGALTSSVAHEFAQPLAAVVTNGAACVRWLNRSEPNLDEARSAAERILRDGLRAGEILEHVRSFIQLGQVNKTSFQANDLVDEVLDMVRSLAAAHKVAVRTRFGEELPAMDADRVQIGHVILNLVTNAIEALATTIGQARVVEIGVDRENGGGLRVSVADSGPGLDPVRREKPFDLFSTTKPHGFGMGLAICRSIVEGHGGRLWVSSEPGKGARFHFILPPATPG